MKSQNVCKFTSSGSIGSTLRVDCFVRETNPEIMKMQIRLKSHRAILVAGGEGVFSIDGRALPFSQGSLIFVFEGETVRLESGKEIVYIYIDFSGGKAEELFRRFNITPLSRVAGGLDGLIPLWQESLATASEQTIDLATESILLYSFSRLFGSFVDRQGIVGEIIRITEQHFRDFDLSLSSIASELSYNPKYVSNIFKKKMGVGYTEYLRSVRLKYAMTLLENGIDSVKNVALLSGFSDALYFSNIFKKVVGVSPTEYVKMRSDR